jgi:DNA-binding HxlR family transcriptional regulator
MKFEEITEPTPQSTHGRWYGDGCGAALGMELLGERWSTLILRELLLGGRRFSQLRLGLPGISARVLTERLASLEAAGLVQRETLDHQLYALTPWGQAAEPILLALCGWALQSPQRNLMLAVSPVAMMLSLRAMFRPESAQTLTLSAQITINRDAFILRIGQGALTIARGQTPADFALESRDTAPLKQLIYGNATPQTLPDLTATGDLAKLSLFASLFALPPQTA